MEAISYTKARNSLAGIMEHVCQDHNPVIITRQQKESVVVMSLEDFNSYEETAYLMASPKNAMRLNESIKDFKNKSNFSKIEVPK
ncbi:MAG: type II toxin-antitoxin system Phd/YefM family antitoxin [Rickettsiaceae bacterium]